MEKELLFKVVTGEREKPEAHHEYKIFSDGSIEGFGDGAIIHNCHPVILGRELAKLQLKLKEEQEKLFLEMKAGVCVNA